MLTRQRRTSRKILVGKDRRNRTLQNGWERERHVRKRSIPS